MSKYLLAIDMMMILAIRQYVTYINGMVLYKQTQYYNTLLTGALFILQSLYITTSIT